MRGKIVNLFVGLTNILFGVLILVYTMYIPQEITELTVQELSVTKSILKAIYVFLSIVLFINILQYRNNRDNSKMKTGYLIGFFSASFFIIQEPAIASFSVVTGIIVCIQALKDMAVDVDSTTAISIASLIMLGIVSCIVTTVFYKNIGQNIKNKENSNNLEYKSDYFKYVTELDYQEPYINVKKDGKYGYITPNGDIAIDFKYDYASPFVGINLYNKDFQVALVCEKGISYIILKNERPVMSYSAESSNEDYEAKYNELLDIYKNTLGQRGKMQTEIIKRTDNKKTLSRYEELPEDYTYRYDYNDEYDLVVTQSNIGSNDKYELARKDDLGLRIKLDCANMDYDDKFMYIYNNGTIPFFNVASRQQGWFTSYGMKIPMTGKAQILDIIDDKILIKDYNDNTIYFIDYTTRQKISDKYKDIYIGDNVYIVQNQDNKYMVIDKDFNKVFEEEFDVIDTQLAEIGLYICANTNEAIDFNDYNFAKMKWKLLDSNGDTMLENGEQIYQSFYKISNDKQKTYVTRYEEFLKNLKKIEFNFVGDKFYTDYNK